jgi:hypothetical protein
MDQAKISPQLIAANNKLYQLRKQYKRQEEDKKRSLKLPSFDSKRREAVYAN